jgi:hypothetical protein
MIRAATGVSSDVLGYEQLYSSLPQADALLRKNLEQFEVALNRVV